MSDNVEHPDHYTTGPVEAIEAIKSALTPEEYRGYLRGQILRYIWRAPYKGNYSEDLQKAQQYLNWLCEELALQHEVYK